MAKKRRKKRKKRSYVKRSSFGIIDKIKDSFKYKRSLYIIAGITAVITIIVIAGVKYIFDNYTVENIYVEGSNHYSNEEIIDMVMDSKLCKNSIFLSFKYKNKSIDGIPFVEKIDVDILSKDTVRINVYEKAIAGYIAYLGRYMYFDREGIVVESSMEPSDDIPEVMGLKFDYVVLHEKLPIENEAIFEEILDVTQLLSKYNLNANGLFFDSGLNLYLYFDDVEVNMGQKDDIDEKVITLNSLYSQHKLDGKKGILHLEDCTGDTSNIIFDGKKQEISPEKD